MFAAFSLALTLLAGLGLGELAVEPAFAEEVDRIPEVGSPDSPASTPEPIETVTPPESPEAFANETNADEPLAEEPRVYLPGGTSTEPITIRWAGENPDVLQQYQPTRSHMIDNQDGSGHWKDFKNLQVSVSKTQRLGTEVVTLSASGVAPTRYNSMFGGAEGNYLQVFQCWGPDPFAADFDETCQFGADERSQTKHGAPARSGGRFKAVTGDVSGDESYAKQAFFTLSSTNELSFVPINSDGTTSVAFETQSAAAQPYLGCGDPGSAAGNRCWLVIVPRGIHSGVPKAMGDSTVGCGGDSGGANPFVIAFGELVEQQGTDPRDGACAPFGNRIVVPLDFDDVATGCFSGGAERRIVGTELLSAAFISWQQGLCAGAKPRAYGFSTNSGDLNRAQLLTGQADFAVVGQPVTADSIGLADPALLDAADLVYAPVANTALSFGFVMKESTTVYTEMKLTPRLLAKLLTQSYMDSLPNEPGSDGAPGPESSESYASRTVYSAKFDPEWATLGNPTELGGYQPTLVVFGPQGDDAVQQLWAYIQADADAVAFLRGEPDPWGMTVNPYYLPASSPSAAGGGLPYDLATDSIYTFLQADQTLVPSKEYADRLQSGLRLDSGTYNPYSSSLHANASRIFRKDSRIHNQFDPHTGIGGGAFRAGPPVDSNAATALLGPVDASTAATYKLTTAQLAAPLPVTTSAETIVSARDFVAPTDEAITIAVADLPVEAGLSRVDPANVPEGGYPLSTVLNAAVNLKSSKLDPQARADYAAWVQYVVLTGQFRGEDPGQLPVGYVPLTDVQRAAADALVARLTATADNNTTSNIPAGSSSRPSDATQPAAPGAARTTSISAEQTEFTEPSSAGVAQVALGASLLAGIGGLAVAPTLLRRRVAL